MSLDDDIQRIQNHLKTVLKVAGKRYDERLLYQVAQRGWLERQKEEKEQTEFAHVCWGAELFAASELLLNQSPTEFEGVAAFLSICAADALDPAKPNRPTTESTLTESLVRQGSEARAANELADQLWSFRCAGAHRGLTDQIYVKFMVIVGENLVSGDTLENVMSEHRKQGSTGPVTLIDESAFSRNMYLFRVARHTSAEAIAHRIIDLKGRIANP